MNKYDDIIGLPHPEPRHPRMLLAARAAQFAPFAALTGHGAAIEETARITDEMIELSTDEQQRLSRRIAHAFEHNLPVRLTVFRPDSRKSGGSYAEERGTIRKIEPTEGLLTFTDGRTIPLRFIVALTIDVPV